MGGPGVAAPQTVGLPSVCVQANRLLAGLCLVFGVVEANGQSEEWRASSPKADVLYQQGWYAQAAVVAARAGQAAERELGPHHPGVATSLNLLALAHRAQGDYATAEAPPSTI
jgi:hypothetical protein